MDDKIKERKEKGNKLFSEKKYKEAIEEYNEALNHLLKDDKKKDENQTAVILSNRSASRFLLGMLLVYLYVYGCACYLG